MATINNITITCDKDHTFTIDKDDWYIYASASECELCGDHGVVTLNADCPECSKTRKRNPTVEVVLKEW
jgi:hypothetical protein